jgi:hypothetical protein
MYLEAYALDRMEVAIVLDQVGDRYRRDDNPLLEFDSSLILDQTGIR